MIPLLSRFWTDDSGDEMADFAILLGIVAVLLIAAFTVFRDALSAKFAAAASVLRIRTN